MIKDDDFRSNDKLLYFVSSLLSLYLKEKGVSLRKFSGNVTPAIEMHVLRHSLCCRVWNNVTKHAEIACVMARYKSIFCLQLLNIYHKAIKSERRFLAFLPKISTEGSKAKTCFPFVSFPDSYLVGSSSSARAKLEPHGVISNASVRFLWIVKLSYVSARFPTEEKQLGIKTLLEELLVVF